MPALLQLDASHIDEQGHVNARFYSAFFIDAADGVLDDTFYAEGRPDPFSSLVLVEQSLRFKVELTLKDRPRLWTRVDRFDEKRLWIRQVITCDDGRKVHTLCESLYLNVNEVTGDVAPFTAVTKKGLEEMLQNQPKLLAATTLPFGRQ